MLKRCRRIWFLVRAKWQLLRIIRVPMSQNKKTAKKIIERLWLEIRQWIMSQEAQIWIFCNNSNKLKSFCHRRDMAIPQLSLEIGYMFLVGRISVVLAQELSTTFMNALSNSKVNKKTCLSGKGYSVMLPRLEILTPLSPLWTRYSSSAAAKILSASTTCTNTISIRGTGRSWNQSSTKETYLIKEKVT